MSRLIPALILLGLATSPAALPPDHAEKMARGLALFRKEIAPLLKEHCVKCHGGEKTKAEFDLATREGLLRGGKDGEAIQPFNAAGSRMMKLIRHEEQPEMPEKKPRLADEDILRIAAWIDLGAPYDGPLVAGKQPPRDRAAVTDADRQWWAFQPLANVAPPAGATHPVDAFLLKAAQSKQLLLNPPAEPRKLIRRAFLDLTGMPPSPEEVDAFLANAAPDAWAKLVATLLESPAYGERWARHWLDVARFAESSGFEHDYDRPHAFHYRDFVIRALNADMPFDQFARWQLAGDEFEPGDPQALMATGFLGAGVFPTQITANEVERTRYDAMDDMLATTSSAFLGLTVGCARCHDHKFDPIPTADYYRMLSTFTRTVRSNLDLDLDGKKVPVMVCAEGYKPLVMHSQGAPFLKETHLLIRGDTNQKQSVAQQGFLQVLTRGGTENQWQWAPPAGAQYSGRRRTLANWMTDPAHGGGAQVARVAVNRLWQHHFGRGLVATPNDFGKTGASPSNPELLGWLAGELIRNGWRLKPIHQLLMTSAAYQQSTATDRAKIATDPDNALWLRRTSRRLEAEAIRDSALAVSGVLDRTMFGAGTLDERSKRRSIYFTVKRSRLVNSMVVFDAPEPLSSQGFRPTTTVAPQALLMMNSAQTRQWALAFAKRVEADAKDPASQIARAYALALGRPPRAEETAAALAFIGSGTPSAAGKANAPALADFCQMLMALNEFITVD